MPDDMTGERQQRAAHLIELGFAARRENRSEDARRMFSDAVSLCRETGDRRQLVSALKGLGQIERDLGRGDAALGLYEEAVTLCRADDDPLRLAHTVRHVGDIHLDAGRPELAEPSFEEALSLYRDHVRPPTLDLANAIRPMAIVKESLGEVDEARRLWEEARSLYSAAGVEAGVTESSARLERLNR